MGCGSSSNTPVNSQISLEKQPLDKEIKNGRVTQLLLEEQKNGINENNSNSEKHTRTSTPIPKNNDVIVNNKKKQERSPSADTNGNTRHDVIVETHEVPKPVAFEVSLDDNPNKDSLIHKHPPKRLQKLEPINAPKLTAEMLEEKQKQAEAKRNQEIERVKTASRKSSKRRRELMQAKEFELAQQQYSQIEEQQRSAGKNRETRQQEIIEKQKRREERARKARERAKKLQEMDNEELDFDVEKDDTFNADEVDSWLDGENNDDPDKDERIYSGRTSPHKKIMPAKQYPHSASTTDSFDNAFMRTPVTNEDNKENDDDFFDS